MLDTVLVAAGDGGLVDVNFPTVAWTWAAFFITLWALSKVAWPMLADKMEERETRIRDGLEKAAEAEKRAQDLLEKQEEILQQSRDEAQKMLAESRAAAESLKNDALTLAQEEIAAERDRAKKEISLERAKALDELKAATIDLTLEAAGRLLERELNDDDHRRLAAEVIAEVESRA